MARDGLAVSWPLADLGAWGQITAVDESCQNIVSRTQAVSPAFALLCFLTEGSGKNRYLENPKLAEIVQNAKKLKKC